MEPPQWLYLPAAGILGGMRMQDNAERDVGLHGGSGAGAQTAAAALISGRSSSPGREGGAVDRGSASAAATRADRRRSGDERLRDANAAIRISLEDHAERVLRKAQRVRDGAGPAGEAAAVPAREKLAALRERVRARAAAASNSSSTTKDRPADSAMASRSSAGSPSAVGSPPVGHGDELVRHRGEGRQLDNELALDLRTSQTIEVSQIHLSSGLVEEAAGTSSNGTGFAADGSQVADGALSDVGGGASGQGSGDSAGSAGIAARTATACAASHTAWHTVAARAAP